MLKKLLSYFKNMKLKGKLLYSYLIVILLPMLFTGFFLITKISGDTLKQTVYTNKISFEQLSNNISNAIDRYTQMTNGMLTDPMLADYFRKAPQPADDYAARYFEFYKTKNYMNTKFALEAADGVKFGIYSNNPELFFDNILSIHINEESQKEAWYKDIVAGQGSCVITSPVSATDGRYAFSIGRVVKDSSIDYVNIILFEIPPKALGNLIEKEGLNKEIYIVGSSNTVIASTSKKFIGKNSGYNKKIEDSLINKEKINEVVEIRDKNSIIFIGSLGSKVPLRDCRIAMYIPTDSITGKIKETIRYVLIILLTSTAIAVVFVLLFSNTLSSRLKKLVQNMSHIRDGNFDVYISYEEKDEIGELSRSFKKMINRVNTLITEVYHADLKLKDLQIKKKEAEIHALQSQMNPHFLFNCMESIRMNLVKKGEHEISDMVENFSLLLRKSIDWREDTISLRKELELVETYLKIQKFRYRDKFDYIIDIPEDLMGNQIPKFTIQPIIENAIYHGIEMKMGKACLTISSSLTDQAYIITIEDDGIGMNTETLTTLNERLLEQDTGTQTRSIGLKNVHQRLLMLFGEQYGLKIESEENKGTRVKILLPLKTGIKEVRNV